MFSSLLAELALLQPFVSVGAILHEVCVCGGGGGGGVYHSELGGLVKTRKMAFIEKESEPISKFVR